jgi:DNA adenine methylase
MNAPYGRYAHPAILDEDSIRALHDFFAKRDVSFSTGDFESTLSHVRDGVFVYLDPPYDSMKGTVSYTGYTSGGFDRTDQERLRRYCDKLDSLGAIFMLSNADTDFINELYDGYRIVRVKAPRAISCKGDGRKSVSEVVVTNY